MVHFCKALSVLVMNLPETANPLGLVFDGSNVYVANSSTDGRITKFNLAMSESSIIVRNGTLIAILFTGWMYQPTEILSLQTGDLVWCEVFRQEAQKFKWLLDLVQIVRDMDPA